jgi:hypothetical protein
MSAAGELEVPTRDKGQGYVMATGSSRIRSPSLKVLG